MSSSSQLQIFIRTQQSYQVSLASSRSSNILSGSIASSIILYQSHQALISQRQHLENQNKSYNQQNNLINSKISYTINNILEANPNQQNIQSQQNIDQKDENQRMFHQLGFKQIKKQHQYVIMTPKKNQIKKDNDLNLQDRIIQSQKKINENNSFTSMNSINNMKSKSKNHVQKSISLIQQFFNPSFMNNNQEVNVSHKNNIKIKNKATFNVSNNNYNKPQIYHKNSLNINNISSQDKTHNSPCLKQPYIPYKIPVQRLTFSLLSKQQQQYKNTLSSTTRLNINDLLKKRKLAGSITQNRKTALNNTAYYLNMQRQYQIPNSVERLLKSYKRSSLNLNTLMSNFAQNDIQYFKKNSLDFSHVLNIAYGAMFGFVIGDSIGSYIIHKNNNSNLNQLITNALQMKNGGIFNIYPAQGTDQTQICLSLSYGLLDCTSTQRQRTKKYNHQIITKKYYQWIESKPFDYPTLMAIAFSQIRKQKNKNLSNNSSILNNSILISSLQTNQTQSLPTTHSRKSLNISPVDQPQLNNQNYLSQKLIHSSLKNIHHKSSLALIKMIPLTLWSLYMNDEQFYQLIKEEMKLITPNQYSIEVCYIYGLILRLLIKNQNKDHQYVMNQVGKYIYGYNKSTSSFSSSSNPSHPTHHHIYFQYYPQILQLWKLSQIQQQIPLSSQNMNFINIPFLFTLIQLQQKKLNFMDSLIKILLKGYNTDTNCSIVMGIVGAVVGYNQIPNYYKNKIIECKVEEGERKRDKKYCSSNLKEVVWKLLKNNDINYGNRN